MVQHCQVAVLRPAARQLAGVDLMVPRPTAARRLMAPGPAVRYPIEEDLMAPRSRVARRLTVQHPPGRCLTAQRLKAWLKAPRSGLRRLPVQRRPRCPQGPQVPRLPNGIGGPKRPIAVPLHDEHLIVRREKNDEVGLLVQVEIAGSEVHRRRPTIGSALQRYRCRRRARRSPGPVRRRRK